VLLKTLSVSPSANTNLNVIAWLLFSTQGMTRTCWSPIGFLLDTWVFLLVANRSVPLEIINLVIVVISNVIHEHEHRHASSVYVRFDNVIVDYQVNCRFALVDGSNKLYHNRPCCGCISTLILHNTALPMQNKFWTIERLIPIWDTNLSLWTADHYTSGRRYPELQDNSCQSPGDKHDYP